MKTIRFYDIDWDTSQDDFEEYEEIDDLPKELIVDEVPDDVDVANEGANFLSHQYGFCVWGFNFEEILANKPVLNS